jgi:hypothetical protein
MYYVALEKRLVDKEKRIKELNNIITMFDNQKDGG